MYGKKELKLSVVSFIEVEGVIPNVGNGEVLGIRGTTKELDAVVFVGEDFNVVDGGAITNSAKGKSIDFVTRSYFRTTMPDGNILKNTRVVSGIGATIKRVGSRY